MSIQHTSQDTILVCPFDWGLEADIKKSGKSMFCLSLAKSDGKVTHKLASLLDGLSAFVHWTTKVDRPSHYIHMAEVVIVPGTAQSLPQVVLKASEDLKAFEREVAALVSLRPVGKLPKPPFEDLALAIAEGSPQKPEAGQSLASTSVAEVQLAIADAHQSSKRSSSQSEDEPEAKKIKQEAHKAAPSDGQSDGQSDGKFDGCSIEDSVDLGEDNSFHFVLVDGHIHGQSTTSKRRIPAMTFVWACESAELFDSASPGPDMLPWNPVGRTKVFLQEKETRSRLLSVAELFKNHNLTHILGKGAVCSKTVSKRPCTQAWKAPVGDKITPAVLQAMREHSGSYLDVAFVF